MTFEEWYSVHKAGCWVLLKENGTKAALKDAWESGREDAYEAGIQEGIDRIYRLHDICPQCKLTNGQHKMDCSRG